MEKRHLKHLNTLEKVAEAQPVTAGARIAAAIVIRNDIIAVGNNQKKTHPFQERFKKNDEAIYLHAETDCIKNALKHVDQDKLSKATLYVCRIKKDGTWGLAKPCKGCMKAIATFNIKNVIYSTDTTGKFEIL